MNKKERATSRFVKVVCPRCAHIQVVFGKSTTLVKCTKCHKLLGQPKGGRMKVKAKVKEVLHNGTKTR